MMREEDEGTRIAVVVMVSEERRKTVVTRVRLQRCCLR